MARKRTALVIFFLCIAHAFASADKPPKVRGVSRAARPLYIPKPGGAFACLDGSDTISFGRVNDDYCDCPDGSDEPGTSACSPAGKFYCVNKGHVGETLLASRVNDGVCDCCDGTDEYGGPRECTDNCLERGREAREQGLQQAKLYAEGAQIRSQYVSEGKKAVEEAAAKLTELKSRIELQRQIVADLEAKKKAVEELQAKEREEILAKQKEEAAKLAPNVTAEITSDVLEASVPRQVSQSEGSHVEDFPPKDAREHNEEHTEDHGIGHEEGDLQGHEGAEEIPPPPKATETVPTTHDEVAPVREDADHRSTTESAPDIRTAIDGNEGMGFGEETDMFPDDGSDFMDEYNTASTEVMADTGTDEVTSLHLDSDSDPFLNSESETETDHFDSKDSYDDFNDEEGRHPDFDDMAYKESDYEPESHDRLDDDFESDYGNDRGDNDKPQHTYEPPVDRRAGLQKPDKERGLLVRFLEKVSLLPFRILSLFRSRQRPPSGPLGYSSKPAASTARSEYDNTRSALNSLENEMKQLETVINTDFGPDKEFYPLQGKCFNLITPEYTYELCPFDKANQKIGAHESVLLGKHQGWDDGGYSKMLFKDGQQCWQGPRREAVVELVCGLKNEVKSVSEPTRCVYHFILTSPAVCSRPHAQILSMNAESDVSSEEEL